MSKKLKSFMVSRKEIHDVHFYIHASSGEDAIKKVWAGKGNPSGTGFSGELPPSCWQVEELTGKHRGNTDGV